MKLPDLQDAIIEPGKLRDYLLSSAHPIGRFKATFFASLGYSREESDQLREDFRALIASESAVFGEKSPYGQKYEVRGTLTGPAGRSARVVTVWIVLVGETSPRFVTAYPG
jgi:hypothetical protein